MYEIDEDGNCDKQNTSHDMDFVCIPGGWDLNAAIFILV